MRKKLIMMLIASTVFLVGCGDNKGNNTTNNTTNNTLDNNVTEIIVVDTTVSSPDDALQILKEGNNRFVKDKSILRNVSQERRDSLKNGQSPYAVIVSCSDSRVTPTTVFNAGLGEIFDVRLAGNVVDDDALGSIEYAVEHLNTPLVVVMGHQSCGAVTATYNEVVKGEKVTGNMESFVEKITPSINKNGTVDDAIHNNIDSVVKEVSEDESIKLLIDQGKVKVIGAYYDLGGKVTFYE
ncbi:carbonic anhydrase [uncultured Clostridium sp.]|uniref:carbonic anhydrase n=1 Tax=uncultured Clostridium sp. TaxID=59620 RepID=UPI0025E9176C|nr:carbonic anhydrase [uncultured Clostridium sp.]